MCISCTDGERAEGMAPVYVYDMINIATRVDAYMAGFVFVLFCFLDVKHLLNLEREGGTDVFQLFSQYSTHITHL